ncbi:Protein CBG25781 [Caenorhabditis briggsae]|uniref:Protein CBG25781 n=1 Tax=Caenorhabditis briggsae TaxID=6238 RepID=B6IGK4_CAEBR|nr:Protein CBG25781 [Caenorhabditis briggsae]CAR99034.1 Protein CBG25781 [Caenorhabditis briggsae]
MEPNLRITLSKKLISFKELEKNLSLKINNLRISSARVVINKMYYTLWETDGGYRLNINGVPTEDIVTDKRWRWVIRLNENEKYCAWIDRGDDTEMNIWFEERETWRGHFRINRLSTATPLAWYEGPVGQED